LFVFWRCGLGLRPQPPTPKSPIPNPQSPILIIKNNLILIYYNNFGKIIENNIN